MQAMAVMVPSRVHLVAAPMDAPVDIPVDAPEDLTVRDRLLRLVHEAPALNKSALCATLGVAWGTVAYHVRILASAGLIEAQAHGRDVLLFPRGLDDLARRQARALRTPEAARVLATLRQLREASLTQVSQLVGMSRKIVRRRLAELMEAGLVHDKGLRRSRYAAVRGPADAGAGHPGRPAAPPFDAAGTWAFGVLPTAHAVPWRQA